MVEEVQTLDDLLQQYNQSSDKGRMQMKLDFAKVALSYGIDMVIMFVI